MRGRKKEKIITKFNHPIAYFGVLIFILAPFMGKRFHIDDPFWIWTARKIFSTPWDFYGYLANWFGIEQWMFEITKTPPLFSYGIAILSPILGWSEFGLHLMNLLWALVAAWGILHLAKEFCPQPLLSGTISILSHIFILCGTTVMCDVMMTACFIWSLALWTKGLKTSRPILLMLSSLFLSVAILTKFNALTLMPLLILMTFLYPRPMWKWLSFLIIPLSALYIFQVINGHLYGEGGFIQASIFTLNAQNYSFGSIMVKGLTGLAFMGGGIAGGLIFFPFLWGKKLYRNTVIFGVLLYLILIIEPKFLLNQWPGLQRTDWIFSIQLAIWVSAGLLIMALSIRDLLTVRDFTAWTLFLWLWGTFIFSCFINWSVNGRVFLPVVPALGILLVRYWSRQPQGFLTLIFPLLISGLFTFLIGTGDYKLAHCGYQAAKDITTFYGKNEQSVWFQGHWGFQYYMEENGGRALDHSNIQFENGDIMAVPTNNTNIYPIKNKGFKKAATLSIPLPPIATTMNAKVGAGFYSDLWGPLPFYIGKIPPEEYLLFQYFEE